MKRFAFMTAMVTGLVATALTAQEIKDRKENQQDRIAQGVKSGQLTAGETAKLETKEAGLNKEIRHDRKQNGGNLTNNEKKQINHQQNKLSRNIYKQKHDAQTHQVRAARSLGAVRFRCRGKAHALQAVFRRGGMVGGNSRVGIRRSPERQRSSHSGG